MVVDRSTRYRLAAAGQGELLHIDLLHHARAVRRQLARLRLQTLEQVVCRRRRTDDIPGQRIPAAYAELSAQVSSGRWTRSCKSQSVDW